MSDLLLWLSAPFEFQFMRTALIAALLIGSLCATIGVYVVLRRMAFIGDALSHTILPGVVIAYLNQWNLAVGALIAGLATALGIGWFSRRNAVREDTAIGVIFTSMLALGVLLMSSMKSFRDFTHILFGNILGVTNTDLWLIAAIAAGVFVVLLLLNKELQLTSFDATYAEVIGLSPSLMRYILLILLAMTVVTTIQMVGVVLVTALLITPAATGALLSNRFWRMTGIAIASAILSSIVGLYASFYANVSSGAAIVLVATGFFVIAWIVRAIRMQLRGSPESVASGRNGQATIADV